MIKFDNVTKKFPLGNLALDRISFEIDDNEFLFLVGPSGAGKTTIIKLILREMLPSSGSIFVGDEDIADTNFCRIEALRRSIGVVFQDFKILAEKNIFENIVLSLAVDNTPKNQIKKEAEQVLSLVGLTDKKFMFPVQLSAGELQRVVIARAISGQRSIILADEPTGNLDPKTAWEVMKIFKKLEGRKTILIATHNVDIVNSFKKRVIALRNGKGVKDQRKGDYEI
jgi:cell division transport system ATP-binding protein